MTLRREKLDGINASKYREQDSSSGLKKQNRKTAKNILKSSS